MVSRQRVIELSHRLVSNGSRVSRYPNVTLAIKRDRSEMTFHSHGVEKPGSTAIGRRPIAEMRPGAPAICGSHGDISTAHDPPIRRVMKRHRGQVNRRSTHLGEPGRTTVRGF